MKANLLYLMIVLCVVALVSSTQKPERIVSVRLLLASQPLNLAQDKPLPNGNYFRLALHAQSDGSAQMSSSQRVEGEVSQGLLRRLSPAEWTSLEGGLRSLPGWRTPTCDGGEPEGQALYTLMEVETSQGVFHSYWRGLPKPQAKVADFLLQSPAGPTLRQGLEQLPGHR